MRTNQAHLKVVDKYRFDDTAMNSVEGGGEIVHEADCIHT